MLNNFFNDIWNLEFTSWAGIIVYWIPMLICMVLYSIEIFNQYLNDKVRRADYAKDEKTRSHYTPRLTIGTVLRDTLITITPVANIFGSVSFTFDILKLFDKFLNIPIVPELKK